MPPPTMTTSNWFAGGGVWRWLVCTGVRGGVVGDVKLFVLGLSWVFRLGVRDAVAKLHVTAVVYSKVVYSNIATTFEYTTVDWGCQSKDAFAAMMCLRNSND
jgi:hypothetical protein